MDMATLLAGLTVGGVAGAAVAALLARSRGRGALDLALAQARAEAEARLAHASARGEAAEALVRRQDEELRTLRGRVEALQGLLAQSRDDAAQLRERAARVPRLEDELGDLRHQLADEGETRQRLSSELRGVQEKLDAERAGAAEKLALLESARQAMADQFKALAADILEDKSRRFTEQNQTQLGQLLDPLRERLSEFQQQVAQAYRTEGQERSALAQQVSQLMALNQSLSAEARGLAEALRGSTKAQGNWGELVLERVLESAGLRKGQEYVTQDSRTGADGQRLRPDVVILLPEERRLVVDAKCSLLAYERHAGAGDDAARETALRAHLDSVRTHLKGLSEKNYQQLYGIGSLDFVLMFMPVEPAFMLAVTHDAELFMDAWRRNVLLVSPSTLLFVLRTVAHLWRQEQQNRNAQEIARRGAELYDRLCGFATELRRAGDQLRQAQRSLDDAEKKLSTGRGNVIRQAEMLRELGLKPTRQLPQPLRERAEADAAALAEDTAPEAEPPETPEADAAPQAALAFAPDAAPVLAK